MEWAVKYQSEAERYSRYARLMIEQRYPQLAIFYQRRSADCARIARGYLGLDD